MKAYALILIGVCLALPGCISPTAPQNTARTSKSFLPDAQGLAVEPGGQRVDFGRSPKGVVQALDRELGKHKALTLSGCPTEITERLRWRELELTFTRERFVGWQAGGNRAGRVCLTRS